MAKLKHLPLCYSLLAVLFLALALSPVRAGSDSNSSASAGAGPLYGIEFPPYNTAVADAGCDGRLVAEEDELARRTPSLKLHMTHRSASAGATGTGSFVLGSAKTDAVRIDTMNGRRAALSGAARKGSRPRRALSERVVATVESGVAVGSGEYLVDVYVGTPPRRFRMIMDTGSDLNWLQCAPCLDCFDQTGPVFDPAASASYRNVTCGDARCGLVSPPPPLTGPRSCRRPRSDTCPYYYWYGDQSNTTGDLALETFTVNLTGAAGTRRVDGVAFGCGHRNRGLFHGAAGLLGLGRGPLSFASQLRGVYGGHAFSYCLVEHGSAAGSKIIFGHDDALLAHPQLNYTAFAPAAADAVDTFYYVQLKSVLVGGEAVNISSDTLAADGTIIDSGTTLSYFPEPAYQAIRQAFVDRMDKSYPLIPGFPVLSPCYNVSGAEKVEVPELSLVFADGAAWDFPAENYFIRLEPEGIMCLAILGTPRSGMSIIGNYQQQNFHVLYDLEHNRLGFAPRRCADV